jgi:hypothetical protein
VSPGKRGCRLGCQGHFFSVAYYFFCRGFNERPTTLDRQRRTPPKGRIQNTPERVSKVEFRFSIGIFRSECADQSKNESGTMRCGGVIASVAWVRRVGVGAARSDLTGAAVSPPPGLGVMHSSQWARGKAPLPLGRDSSLQRRKRCATSTKHDHPFVCDPR